MLTLTWTQIAVAVVILLAIGYCLGIWVERDSGPLPDDERFGVKRSAPGGLIQPKPVAIPRAGNLQHLSDLPARQPERIEEIDLEPQPPMIYNNVTKLHPPSSAECPAAPRSINQLAVSDPESPAKNPFVESAKKSVR